MILFDGMLCMISSGRVCMFTYHILDVCYNLMYICVCIYIRVFVIVCV